MYSFYSINKFAIVQFYKNNLLLYNIEHFIASLTIDLNEDHAQ